jgi:peptidoglycan hydrolase CwlO-like protein
MRFKKRIYWVAIAVLSVVIWATFSAGVGSADAVQDVSSLDRRISMLEQRFYSLDSSMNRLQQLVASQRSPAPAPDSRDREINQITEEIQRLQLRLVELQCGLVKLDERTATRRSGEPKSTDPCRANPDAPLRFSSRP